MEVVRKHRKMQQAMPTKDRLNNEIDSVAEDRQRDSILSAATVQRENAVIDGKISCKLDEGFSIGLNQLDLASETFLARDFAFYPAFFPFPPGWQGKCLEHSVGGVEARDRSIEVTIHLGSRNTVTRRNVAASGDLIVQQILSPSIRTCQQLTDLVH